MDENEKTSVAEEVKVQPVESDHSLLKNRCLINVPAGKVIRVEICDLPDMVEEVEGVPYALPKTFKCVEFLTGCGGSLCFVTQPKLPVAVAEVKKDG